MLLLLDSLLYFIIEKLLYIIKFELNYIALYIMSLFIYL